METELSWNTPRLTYKHKCYNHKAERPGDEYCDDPDAQLAVETHEAGIRVILSSDTTDSPNLFIEREPGGWVVVIHPYAGDALGELVITDDRKVGYIRELAYPCCYAVEITPQFPEGASDSMFDNGSSKEPIRVADFVQTPKERLANWLANNFVDNASYPPHPISAWQEAVSVNETHLGYRDWVRLQVELEEEHAKNC